MGHILRTGSTHIDFIKLAALLDTDLAERDGEENTFYAQFNGIAKLMQCIVFYVDDIPVGCGAIKSFDENSMEIKRMYVSMAYRGKGVASLLLSELEKWTKELGYMHCVLETGLRQPEAVALYEKNNYERIPNYPPYEQMANSVCFRKRI